MAFKHQLGRGQRNRRVTGHDGRLRSEAVAQHFGRKLFQCRRRAAMSQEELGLLAGLHRTEIGMLEHGNRLARVDTLIKLAGALSISPLDLLEGIQWLPASGNEGSFAISKQPLKATATRVLPAARTTKGGV